MAATPLAALGDLYESVSPTLPVLWAEIQPEGRARNLPNGMISQKNSVPLVQRNAGVNGSTGVRVETVKARFSMWFAGRDLAGTALSSLLAYLTPFAVTVTGAKTYLHVDDSSVPFEPQRGPQGEYVFVAWADVTVQPALWNFSDTAFKAWTSTRRSSKSPSTPMPAVVLEAFQPPIKTWVNFISSRRM